MTDALIRLRHVSRTFPGPAPVTALDDIDLTVERGDYVSIVGPSGSGKSTLLNVIGLLDQPSAGEYVLDDVSTTALTADERARMRARSIGFVFQSFHLVSSRSVLENVRLGMLYNRVPRGEREERARRVVTRLGLAERCGFLPPTLSGGERQRVAIARALVSSPPLLLADEPTGNLDGRTSDEVMGVLDELHAEGLTLVVITHDPQVADRATRSIRIERGRLEELR